MRYNSLIESDSADISVAESAEQTSEGWGIAQVVLAMLSAD